LRCSASLITVERLDLLLHRDQLAVARGELLLQVVARGGGLRRLLEHARRVDETDAQLGLGQAAAQRRGAQQDGGKDGPKFQGVSLTR